MDGPEFDVAEGVAEAQLKVWPTGGRIGSPAGSAGGFDLAACVLNGAGWRLTSVFFFVPSSTPPPPSLVASLKKFAGRLHGPACHGSFRAAA